MMLQKKKSSLKGALMPIICYSACSCSMLLINKLAMYHIPLPSFVSIIQFAFCTVFIYCLTYLGYGVDRFEWKKVKPYLLYCIGFAGGCYANMRTLEASNVETVIVFRASTPMAVSIMDYFFLGRELPSARSGLALLAIVFGSFSYVHNDSQFMLDGLAAYTWASVYFCFLCFTMVYGKFLIRDIEMQSKISGSVLYTNALSIPMMLMFAYLKDEYGQASEVFAATTSTGFVFLVVSCIAGTGISYAGWWCRDCVSATTYTLVGVLNKLFTVAVNCMIWDQHASNWGIASLSLCLLGGAFYRQAPMRAKKEDTSPGESQRLVKAPTS